MCGAEGEGQCGLQMYSHSLETMNEATKYTLIISTPAGVISVDLTIIVNSTIQSQDLEAMKDIKREAR